ncbi:MAG: alpha/beta hydrolase [Bacteroidales bacterium]|nr:alpha/beta hydrolase [Bacteroidales bacterium]
MRKIITIFLLLLSVSSYAQDAIKLWGDSPDDYQKRDVELFFYPADRQHNSKVAIIFCPGGSYCYLAKKNEGHDPAKMFCHYGVNSFVLIYRRGIKGNRYPAQIQDLQRAMIYVRDNAEKLGIDADKVGVCGFSAGGHLSGTSAEYFNNNYVDNQSHNLRPDFSIMMYPVVSMQDDIGHKKSRRNLLGQYYDSSTKDSLSLELNVHDQMPPVYIVACKDDPIVDYRNAVRMSQALESIGNVHKFTLYETGGHGFGVNSNLIKSQNPEAAFWYKDFIQWFNTIFNFNLTYYE